jgi:polyferredoxin
MRPIRPCWSIWPPPLLHVQIEIWPHEFYFVAGLLIMAGIGLFLVTIAVGRAWCGYACPQTVWTDLFQHVDR